MITGISGVDPDKLEQFQRLCAEPPADPRILRAEVATYVHALRVAAETDERVDLRLVEEIGRGLVELLRAGAAQDDVRLVQGAVRYFVAEDEAQADDVESAYGFEDDRRIFNAVAQRLGRGDLVIIPRE